MKDSFGRNIDYMRISVTDRCNLRCVYCMPEEGIEPISHCDILTYEEILRLVGIAAGLGIKKIRLTGGEPLVRRGIENLVKDIKGISGIESVSMTTNGTMLYEKLPALINAGIDSINISLDTLKEEKYEAITRRPGLGLTLMAIDNCLLHNIPTKVNVVAMKDVNDDEFCNLARLAKDKDIAVRFIEYMPVGKKDFEKCVSKEDIIKTLEAEFGPMEEDMAKYGNGPAIYFKPKDFKGSIGIISAMTCSFCESCNRVRLTADGFLKLCLQYNTGISLRDLMRAGATDEEIAKAIEKTVLEKPKQHIFNEYFDAENIEENGMSRIGG